MGAVGGQAAVAGSGGIGAQDFTEGQYLISTGQLDEEFFWKN